MYGGATVRAQTALCVLDFNLCILLGQSRQINVTAYKILISTTSVVVFSVLEMRFRGKRIEEIIHLGLAEKVN